MMTMSVADYARDCAAQGLRGDYSVCRSDFTVAQGYNYSSAEQAVWRTGLYNMLFLGSLGVFFIFMAEPIVRLFTQDPAVVPLAAKCLRIVSYGNIGYAYAMVMLQAFNGAGDTVTPTIVNFFGFWLLEIPLAYWLAIPMRWQSSGAFYAIVIAEGSIALASAVLFKRGKWKTRKI